ncbi:MAG: ATP-binding cassette domain-containing protein [Desulfobulbales bacterium]|nr:ATP-binding cassette domain-containing protein [Desulfobulbales bacterium]
MDIYQIRDVDHYYGDKQVLSIEDLSIPEGSITGLAGPNGSGKSTLLKLMAFLERPTYGAILFNDKKVAPFSKEVRSRVTLLNQEPYLMHRSVFENVAYGLKVRKKSTRLINRVEQALNLVGLTEPDFARRKWYQLSGGEAQRVALAARLALRPRVLLLDEPTASVDMESAGLIRDASLQARRKWGTTLVVATHDWQWLYETCDTGLHLLHGRIFKGGLGCAVSGPWRFGEGDMLLKELEGDQVLVVPKPDEGKNVAVLDPAKLKVVMPGDDPQLNTDNRMLNGFVTRLFLERNGKTVQVAIKVAELLVTLRMASSKAEEFKLYPAAAVRIIYDPREIEWF